MATIGSSTITVTLSSPTDTLTGTIDAAGAVGTFGSFNLAFDAAVFGPATTHFTLDNIGLVESIPASGNIDDAGILLATGGTITNQGTIEGGNGIFIGAGGKSLIDNTGTIIATSTIDDGANETDGFLNYGVGIYADSAANINNTGTIGATHIGIVIENAVGTVTNSGLISSQYGYGAYLRGGGTLINTGTIDGYGQGIFLYNSAATTAAFISNTGLIDAPGKPHVATINGSVYTLISSGIFMIGAGTIENLAAGTIESANGGIGLDLFANFIDFTTGSEGPVPGKILNAGSIIAAYGAEFYGIGGITNTGKIFAVNIGAEIQNSRASITNSGFIEATGTTFAVGTVTSDAAGILAAAGGTITNTSTGTIIATGADGVSLQDGGVVLNQGVIIGYRQGIVSGYDAAATVINTGSIIATGTTFTSEQGSAAISHGILLKDGGAVSNASTGTIIGDTGIVILGTAKAAVDNAGHVTSTGHAGIYLYGAGNVTNAKTGTVQAARAGIELYGGGQVYNYGVINAGKAGIYLKIGGAAYNYGAITAATSGIYDVSDTASVYNEVGARIIAGANGIDLETGGQAYNAGFLYGTISGIFLGAAGNVTNTKSGTIAAGTLGIHLAGGGTVDNAGLISSEGGGISIKSGRAINTGTILTTGIADGIYLGGTAATAINGKTGLIEAATGILLFANGAVTNAGTIETTFGNGIVLDAGGTVTNAGLVAVTNPVIGGGDGIVLDHAGLIINTGTITAAADGIQVTQGGTVIDSGTIIAGGDAIYFETGASNLLILSPTAVTTGTVHGGGGALELEADGKKIGTAAPSQFIDFASVTIESKAIWDLAGTFATSLGLTLVNDGTLKESAADLITIAGALTGNGTVELSKKLFTLDGRVAAGEKIKFSGTGETLALGDASVFDGKIEKFKFGDTIDLTGVPISAITGTHFAKGVLTLSETSGSIALTFASPASFGKDVFTFKTAGDGTEITLAKAADVLTIPGQATPEPMLTKTVTEKNAQAGWPTHETIPTATFGLWSVTFS